MRGLLRPSVWLSVLVPAAIMIAGGYRQRWASDDGFINLRVVSQLLAGNGFVFNAGERSEAVTSAGWVLVLWFLGAMGLDLERAAWIASLALSALGVGLAAAASASICRDGTSEQVLVVPFGMLAYVAIPVAWDYATSGLENGLGLAYLGAAYWFTAACMRRSTVDTPAAVAAFIGLAPLVRPDFVLYAAPLTLLLMASAATWPQSVRIAFWAAVPGLAYQLFRMAYFAALVPNTALAKEAFETRWDQGFLYLMDTIGTYVLALPLFCALLGGVEQTGALVRRGRSRLALVPLCLAAAGLVHILYIVRVGGDFMHGRMLLPGLFAIFASVGVMAIGFQAGAAHRRTLIAIAALAGWALACGAGLRVLRYEDHIVDERLWYVHTSRERNPTRLDHYRHHPFHQASMAFRERIAEGCPRGAVALADEAVETCKRVALLDPLEGEVAGLPPDASLPLRDSVTSPRVVGVVGFRPLGISSRAVGLRVNVVDGHGLADPLAARFELTERGRPGHEKAFSSVWFAAKYGTASASDDARVLAARQALECGLLRELHNATHEPLTLSRMTANISLAFRLHRLRVPADPREAIRRFCDRAGD